MWSICHSLNKFWLIPCVYNISGIVLIIYIVEIEIVPLPLTSIASRFHWYFRFVSIIEEFEHFSIIAQQPLSRSHDSEDTLIEKYETAKSCSSCAFTTSATCACTRGLCSWVAVLGYVPRLFTIFAYSIDSPPSISPYV